MSEAVALVAAAGSSWFQRFLLPGFYFKAVVVGRGYATIAGALCVAALVALFVTSGIFLATCAVPLLTIGVFHLVRGRPANEEQGFSTPFSGA